MEKYYIWLLLALGEGRPEISQLLERFGTAQKAYEAFAGNTALLGAELTAKASGVSLEKAEKTLAAVTDDGTQLITWESEDYPEHLRRTENPPCVLFAKGDTSLLHKKLITMVGSRAITEYTASVIPQVIERLGKEYAIVGSLSEGCDQLICMNALKYRVPFIEILPCGLSHTYPTGSRTLRRFLLENNGLLISEFLPKTGSGQGNFLRRSRVIGGISYVTLVCQAGSESGALATAEYSSAPVFIPPHDIFRKEYSGVVNAVRNGAKLYISPASIDKAYEHAVKAESEEKNGKTQKAKYRTAPGTRSDNKNDEAGKKPEEKASPEKTSGKALTEADFESAEQYELYTVIANSETAPGLEELMASTGRSAEQLAEILLDLEITGKVICTGSRYRTV